MPFHKQGTFKCDFCDEEFTFKPNLSRHMKRRHEFDHVHFCTQENCTQAFENKAELDEHTEIWSGVRTLTPKFDIGPRVRTIFENIVTKRGWFCIFWVNFTKCKQKQTKSGNLLKFWSQAEH